MTPWRSTSSRPVASWPTVPRTHACGQVGSNDVNERVVLAGWVLAPRKISRQLAFVPLQDASGTVQLVLHDPALVDAFAQVPVESVVSVQGAVQARAEGAVNPAMRTGAVEVRVESWTLLNAATPTLPFYATQCREPASLPKESLRAKHRYLDLRRSSLSENIRRRSRVAHAARCFLHDHAFTEIETPILLRSTPEGAREFLVPTRSAPEPQFYALQQSPQQPKQLLMVSGVTDRYFQFAKCFRDEDGRKDRQPEFTQLDMEMSFVCGHGDQPAWPLGGTEIRDVTEGLVRSMWTAAAQPYALPNPFPIMSYEHAMTTYGSDKPDTRFGLRIANLIPTCTSHALDILVLPQYESCKLSGRAKEALLLDQHGHRCAIEHFKAHRSAPDKLAHLLLTKSRHVHDVMHSGKLGPADRALDVSSLTHTLQDVLRDATAFRCDGASAHAHGDSDDRCDVYLATRSLPIDGGSTPMGDLRLRIADALPIRSAEPAVLWITQFPLFTRADADKAEAARGRWSSSHHPFTAPLASDVQRLYESVACRAPADRDAILAQIHGQHYDLVLNGAEIGGGSVRVHDPALQRMIFRDILELTDDEVGRFSHLLHALESGAPPHAGIALGFDRFMAILCDTLSIRDVMAFPKTGSGTDPLFSSPAALDAPEQRAQLAAYSLQARSA